MKQYSTEELLAEIERRKTQVPSLVSNKGAIFFKNLSFKKANKCSIIHEDINGNEYVTRTTRVKRINGKLNHFEGLPIVKNW